MSTASVNEFAKGVIMACLGGKVTVTHDQELIREGLLKDVDEGLALGELFMLRLSAAAYVLQTCFDKSVHNQMRDAYGRIVHKMLLQSGNKDVQKTPNTMIDRINERYGRYMAAIDTPHIQGPLWNVGKVFADCCRQDWDVGIIVAASIQWAGCIEAAREFLGRSKPLDTRNIITL